MTEEKNELVEGSKSTSTESGEETVEKTYTETEVREMLQREADRRVSSALKKQQKAFDEKMAEADKLRNMDEDQRKNYEYEQKVKELEEREKEFTLTQNKLEATKVLINRGLPVEFVDYVVAEDADTMLENINTFDKMFTSAVNDAVSKKISTPSPKSGSARQTGLTKDDFKNMTVAQQAEIYRSNPELYKEMTK